MNLLLIFPQFFKESNGDWSMTRLILFILIVGGLTFAFIYPDYEMGYLGIIGLGLGGKVGQKIIEQKKDESKVD